jgi:hypothetical protein
LPRKRDIEAGVAAHNRTAPARQELPPEVARLLAVLFAQDDVCQRSVGSLLAEGFGRAAVIRLLRGLTAAGFVSKDPGRKGLTGTFRLHLPSRRQP